VQLLVIRHAVAEEREAFAATGRDDSLRPLTEDGARKMRRVARGLRQVVPTIGVLVTSPFTRAAQTADIVAAEYGLDGVQSDSVLEPERPVAEVVAWLRRVASSPLLAVVGHEPQLGRLVTYLLGGGDRTGVVLKKGGACLLEFDDTPRAGAGRLVWSVPPSVLRDLTG
jgi:phosphohistidine phosphatase